MDGQSGVLTAADLARVEESLEETDGLLDSVYPGDDGSRQPVHTVYVAADLYTEDLPRRWGDAALASVEEAGGLERVAAEVGVDPSLVGTISERVAAKLAREPIEDLRLDFEDGYGHRGAEEDADALAAAARVSGAVATGAAPPLIGIRMKSLERATRARGLRTLDLFVDALMSAGGLPTGFVVTLPKVSTVAQVTAMADVMAALERAHGLSHGRLRFEVQVESPQLVLGADGRSPVAQLVTAAPGRISGLHYGTYDYSASLGIAVNHQSTEHPAADLAKGIMQLAAAGTGIRLSDGSSNILATGEHAERARALHARLVRRSLERGFYQGWDLHPSQLPTRYLATYAFYREAYPALAERLGDYLARRSGDVMDEPATARALAGFVLRGLQCGALDESEIVRDLGLRADALAQIL